MDSLTADDPFLSICLPPVAGRRCFPLPLSIRQGVHLVYWLASLLLKNALFSRLEQLTGLCTAQCKWQTWQDLSKCIFWLLDCGICAHRSTPTTLPPNASFTTLTNSIPLGFYDLPDANRLNVCCIRQHHTQVIRGVTCLFHALNNAIECIVDSVGWIFPMALGLYYQKSHLLAVALYLVDNFSQKMLIFSILRIWWSGWLLALGGSFLSSSSMYFAKCRIWYRQWRRHCGKVVLQRISQQRGLSNLRDIKTVRLIKFASIGLFRGVDDGFKLNTMLSIRQAIPRS